MPHDDLWYPIQPDTQHRLFHDLATVSPAWARYLQVLRGEAEPPTPDWDPDRAYRAWLAAEPPNLRYHRILAALRQWLREARRRLRRYLAAPGPRLVRGTAAAAVTGALVLGAASSIAAGGPFVEQTGADNPLYPPVDVGSSSKPTFVDIDDDGDPDVFIGEHWGAIAHYENTGTAASPAFVERTGAANPFDGVDVGSRAAPAFADIDDDGDYDVFIGERYGYGTVTYYENTGTAASPAFVERTGAANPLNGVSVGDSTPAFVDVDDDGDQDVFVGEYYGTVKHYENTGTAASPAFVERTGAANPLNGVSVGYTSRPTFVDIDDDGDPDAFIGASGSDIRHYENTGTAVSPAFVARTGAANPVDGVDVASGSSPTFVDIDDDGDYDVFVGEGWGTIAYYENTGDANNPAFEERLFHDNPFGGVDVGERSKPAFVDIDDDGDQDVFIGAYNGTLKYYENTGTAASPAFVERTGTDNPFNGVDVGDRSKPTFVDIDDDDDLDAFIGEDNGTIKYYENTGTAASPAFVARTGTDNPFDGVNVGDDSIPALVDIDDDGDYDAFIGEEYGGIRHYENTGTAASPAFVERTGTDNPFDGVDVGWGSAPAFVDVDDDGDPDAFIGGGSGWINHYENTGTAASPAFVARTSTDNPFYGVVVGSEPALAFVDIDDDGDPDAFIGEYYGTIRYYRHGYPYKLYLPLALWG